MSSILLDSLRDDLNESHRNALKFDTKLYQLSEKYLGDLLINDELLSTDQFTTTATNSKNITQEIAELDLQQHQINKQLSSLTDSHKDLIIDVNYDLNEINQNLTNDYAKTVAALKKSLNIDSKFHPTDYKSSRDSILSNIDTILDILELPTLCRLCILQGNYQESLEISIFIKSLIIRFPKLQLFRTISNQIESELKVMLKGLLKLLNTNLKQNHILKIFQILSKLESVDYKSLHRIYLNSRFKFIINEIGSLQPILKFNKLTYLKRFVEVYREHIYSSIHIYYTIFKNEIDKLLLNQFITTLATNLCREFVSCMPHIAPVSHDSIESELELKNSIDGLILQLIYLCKSLSTYQFEFESIILSELCYKHELISESDWIRNSSKIKKHK
ncbi:hypothetical protein CORT_0E02390 [Candida orthopsilosis Co 90-125]|uniref:Conserved oligomeric Golgi complex subunit 8 n=1 Tax=Candida orthopsilosis (strain 90-125) TaxID=1136231 RepID=H8X7P1_CANO9|nr:hypothetical protein CORT_0E02390 [Candida orthopsilosis Co 90-125]CCG23826.1 hypothetical protein CORT_0E02390 [Candida orthopsilosis Co 90-125]